MTLPTVEIFTILLTPPHIAVVYEVSRYNRLAPGETLQIILEQTLEHLKKMIETPTPN